MDWLNYHHLLYFWTVAREGSIVRASEKLRLAQPTISGQIRKLEEALGVDLFERQNLGGVVQTTPPSSPWPAGRPTGDLARWEAPPPREGHPRG